MDRRTFWVLLLLFIFSRLFFLADFPHFFDSPEYLRLAQASGFTAALTQAHASVHPVYLFLSQIFQGILPLSAVRSLSFLSFIFGLLGFIAFYHWTLLTMGRKIALFASIPVILFPHTFLIHTQVMHESLDHGLFLLGLMFFALFLKRRTFSFSALAVLFLSLSIFDYVGMVLWLPVVIATPLLISSINKKRAVLQAFIVSLASIVLGLGLLYLVLRLTPLDPIERLRALAFTEGGALMSFIRPLEVLRSLRNAMFITFFGYSPLLPLVLLWSLVVLLRHRSWHILLFIAVWLASFLLSIWFWHGGLYGRLGGLVAYPFALILALLENKKSYTLILGTLLVIFIHTVFLYSSRPIPEVQKALIDTLPESNAVLVFSDYQRPQLEEYYPSALYVSSHTYPEIEEDIQQVLDAGSTVYISQQAATFPYLQYDGQGVHILSYGDFDRAHLKSFLQNKGLEPVAENPSFPLLSIYRLTISTREILE